MVDHGEEPATDPLEGPAALWRRQARSMVGDDYAHAFAERFDRLAAEGEDVHGEATFVAALVEPPARVLDAGCGTGRVAERLAVLGYDVEGVDVDDAMVAVARERAPHLTWHVADLAAMDLGTTYDLVVLAGNVLPFVEPERWPAAALRITAHLRPGGLVVCGFGLDRAHLPPGVPVRPLDAYDEAMAAAGLTLRQRTGGWDASPPAEGYAVSVHERLG